MERATASREVMHLYDRLRECIRANNRKGVEETCRELARAGRPLAEIMREGGIISDDLNGMKPDERHSAAYYWGSQWSARPDLTGKAPQLPTASSKSVNISDSQTQNPNKPALEFQIPASSSRQDWVEEWHARQQLPHPEAAVDPERSRAIDIPDAVSESSVDSDITSRDSDQSQLATQDITRGSRILAKRLPTLARYSGTGVLVGISLLLILHFGKTILGAGSSEESGHLQPALVWDAPPNADRRNDQSATIQPSVSTRAKTAVSEPHTDTASAGSKTESAHSLPVPSPLPATAEPDEQTSEAASITDAAPAKNSAEAPPGLTEPASTNPTPDFASSGPNPTSTSASENPDVRNGTQPSATASGLYSRTETSDISVPTQPSNQAATATRTPNQTSSELATAMTPAPPSPSTSTATGIDAQALVERGDMLFGTGDIASARSYYERAVDDGSAEAAIRLGETFDPAFLSRARLNGVRGDSAVALKWYKRARELGATEADILVLGIEAK